MSSDAQVHENRSIVPFFASLAGVSRRTGFIEIE